LKTSYENTYSDDYQQPIPTLSNEDYQERSNHKKNQGSKLFQDQSNVSFSQQSTLIPNRYQSSTNVPNESRKKMNEDFLNQSAQKLKQIIKQCKENKEEDQDYSE